MMNFLDKIVDWWLRRCEHHEQHVAADILAGSGRKSNVSVSYCCRCGAVRPNYSDEWDRPRPLWYRHDGSQP